MKITLPRTMRTQEEITLPAYFVTDCGVYTIAIYAPDNMVRLCLYRITGSAMIERKPVPASFTTDGLMRITEEQWQQAVQEFRGIVNNALNTLP